MRTRRPFAHAFGVTFVALTALACLATACTLVKGARGEPCSRDVECQSNFCVASVCASVPPHLEPTAPPPPPTDAGAETAAVTPDASDASDASAQDASGDGG